MYPSVLRNYLNKCKTSNIKPTWKGLNTYWKSI